MSPASSADLDRLAINTIRTLSMDAVQRANSGHPGTPMALAPVAYAVWRRALRYDPAAPNWPARDRFILSCGHASMLLYSLLHLAGVRSVDDQGRVTDRPAISLDDIRNFRQLGSPCAGHPELGDAPGIETTTGPLGQGLANSVGLAIAAKWLAARYNRPEWELFDFDTYVLASDGDIMEGVGCEAASLAGHLKLSNLCWIYDDNHITIEGDTKLAFSEDVSRRFEALGWRAVRVEDANDLAALEAALETFRRTDDRPTLIVVRSVIAYGAPNKANTAAAHGAPLGDEEVRLAKRAYGWPEDAAFLVPEEAKAHFAAAVGGRGGELRAQWEARFAQYAAEHPREAAELQAIWRGELPEGWEAALPEFPADAKGLATRVASGKVLNAVAARIPWILGGSADLAPSNMTLLQFEGAGHFSAEDRAGRNLHFGVREHVMAGAANGLSLAGLRPYAGTFFVFSDYLRPAMRMSAIMRRPVLYIFTHDSIGLGEDGTTHQPVEQLAACRAIPRLLVIRPADANEVAEAYRVALGQRDRPVALVLTRQATPTLDRSQYAPASGLARGAYVLADPPDGRPQVILIGTGSETALCLQARQLLAEDGVAARVVSMPCWELFDEQDEAYRRSVLPPDAPARVAVEAGLPFGWDKYLGPQGRFVGLADFGKSAPYKTLYEHFGLTPQRIAAEARAALNMA